MKETNKKFSYKPLWKLLIDREISKQKLRELTGLSPAPILKLTRGQNVYCLVYAMRLVAE